jgi:pimeloyl-ACP methyl ester carboxylesterase
MATATVLLVHGSWHGPWCWERVIPELARLGLPSRAIALPSCGSEPDKWGDLAADGRAITEAAAAIPGPVVVVGHSYGGVALTEAELAPNVRHLAYLGAFMPALGKALLDYLPPGPLPPYVEVDAMGVSRSVPAAVGEYLYGDCSEEDVAWAKAQLVPQNGAVVPAKVSRCSWAGFPSTYILLTEDKAVPVPLQRHYATQAGAVVEMATSHSPFLSQPAELARVIAGIAG